MKSTICPACVNDFLAENPIDEIGDELWDLNSPMSETEFELCQDHDNLDIELQLSHARVSTKQRYDEITAIEIKPSRPSQGSIRLVK